MLEIGLGVAAFSGTIVCLVLVIFAVRSLLVPAGEVEITVNETRAIKARTGDKLLSALVEADIHLSSACGGVGTCGQCRLRVLDGGGAALPTEASHLTRRELADGTRLACQVAIKQDMAIRVPEEIFGVRQWQCRVRSSLNVATLIREIVLELPPGESIEFQAGSYVVVSCPPYQARFSDFEIGPAFRDEWDRFDLWRYRAETETATTRAYSLANAPAESEIVMLVVRIAIPPPGAPTTAPPGVVSSYLFGLKADDRVSVSGPFGNFFARESEREMILVGGGAGMAPLRCHILDQLKRLKSKRKISFWYGARSLRELFYVDQFDRLQREHDNFQWVVALSDPRPEDDWRGETGFIHEVLFARYLKDHPAPEDCDYYLCGPPMMIKAVRNMVDNLGVDPDTVFFDDFGG